jgi:acyl-coenzyme A thioesterase PaaI-like protein
MSTHEQPFSTPAPMPPYNAVWATRRRIAQQLRDINEQLLTHDVPHDELLALEKCLASVMPVGAQATKVGGRLAWAETETDNGTYHLLSRETTPIAGHANAMSPPLHMWLDHDKKEAHARITLGWAYEGPPKCAHGGWVAALFDEFLGCAQLLSTQTGATGNLQVRYHHPTPLNVELVMHAEIKEVHGRKLIMKGTITANGKVTASCEGLFVSFAEGVLKLADRGK